VPQRLLGQFPMTINRGNMSMNREFFARNREFHLQTTPHEVFDRHRWCQRWAKRGGIRESERHHAISALHPFVRKRRIWLGR